MSDNLPYLLRTSADDWERLQLFEVRSSCCGTLISDTGGGFCNGYCERVYFGRLPVPQRA